MKIYGSSFSPYARKILAFCGEAGIDYELQAVGLGSDDPEFLAASIRSALQDCREGEGAVGAR